MSYEEIYFEDYEISLEIKVVHGDNITKVLSKFSVNSTTNPGYITKEEYEDFIFRNFIKNHKEFRDALTSLDDRVEQNVLKFKVLETIYSFNNGLRPSEVVLHENQLFKLSDAIKLHRVSFPRLDSTSKWISSSSVDKLIDPEPLKWVIDDIWESMKTMSSKDYLKQFVEIIDMEIPVLDLKADQIQPILDGFVERGFESNGQEALSNKILWVAYVLEHTIPHLDRIRDALREGNYFKFYGQSVILLQFYIAVLQVNPELDWDRVDWSSVQPGTELPNSKHSDDIPKRHVSTSSKRMLNKRQPKSSKQEAEAEQKRFKDLDYKSITDLEDRLKKYVVGQDHAIKTLVDAISIAKVGIRNPVRPIGNFLFAGTTGIGKTELAKAVALELTGRPAEILDMSSYQQAHEIAKLFGSPPGYIGFEDHDTRTGGTPPATLASKIKANPFTVVLFDEIEKANEAVFNVLLNIMDEGRIVSGRGEEVSFSDCVIILSSNVGSSEASNVCSLNKLGFGEDCTDKGSLKQEVIDKAIKKKFKPEFLNRLTEVVHFNSLDKEVCLGVAEILLNKSKIYLQQNQNMELVWDENVKRYLVDIGFSEEFGARNLDRTIHKELNLPLAKYLLAKFTALENQFTPKDGAKIIGVEPTLSKHSKVMVGMDEGQLTFNYE